MLPLIALAAPVLAAAAPDAIDPARTLAPDRCQAAPPAPVARREPARAHPLGSEPNAALLLTVVRSEDGCVKPVIIRDDIGGDRR